MGVLIADSSMEGSLRLLAFQWNSFFLNFTILLQNYCQRLLTVRSLMWMQALAEMLWEECRVQREYRLKQKLHPLQLWSGTLVQRY